MSTIPEQSSKPSGNWSQLLLDKVVFITGAGGGIGAAVAHTCALHGARVVVADINKTTADETVKNIIDEDSTKNDRVIAIELDIGKEQSIENAVKIVVEKWQTIDVLVNNAAIFTQGTIDTLSAESWSEILNINVRGYALMAKAVVPYLKQQKSGSIIQLGSVGSWIAFENMTAYTTTKGAILQMTRNLALDLGQFNIRCNTICPGAIVTPAFKKVAADLNKTVEEFAERYTPVQCIKRLGSPQEVANLVVFLASDLCGFMTGASLTIDGGYTVL